MLSISLKAIRSGHFKWGSSIVISNRLASFSSAWAEASKNPVPKWGFLKFYTFNYRSLRFLCNHIQPE